MALLPYIAEAENLFETSGKGTIYFTKKKGEEQTRYQGKGGNFFYFITLKKPIAIGGHKCACSQSCHAPILQANGHPTLQSAPKANVRSCVVVLTCSSL
jgi:hypothetical protein